MMPSSTSISYDCTSSAIELVSISCMTYFVVEKIAVGSIHKRI